MTRAGGVVTGSAGPFAAMLADGRRLHLQHGPIDLIVEAFGPRGSVAEAYRRAWERFRFVLDELVEELPALRRPFEGSAFSGSVARRMSAAVAPFSGGFITPMAAVAGAVADEVLSKMLLSDLERAFVNDGGDIALFLSPGQRFDVGLVPLPDRPALLGAASVRAEDLVRGVATSGRHGRSFSFGVADAVTVLAADAARADAAATVVANAVDLPGHPAVERTPASELDPDSDLGARPVTTGIGRLSELDVRTALEAGWVAAERLRSDGLIVAAILCLEGRLAIVGPVIASARPEIAPLGSGGGDR